MGFKLRYIHTQTATLILSTEQLLFIYHGISNT